MLFLVIATLKWRAVTYQIHEKAIYIESGLFVTKKRWGQPDRIQSIDSTVHVCDHLFSTRTLTIEIAGGEESSITLSCLSEHN
jgi:putative membrane protein